MPQEDVDNLLKVAVVNRKTEEKLLEGRVEEAAVLARIIHPGGINLSEIDIRGLKSIKAPKLSGFAEACIRLGLASGKERL